jgi:alpha-ketoglutarate-dependent taurine dioxygenase
MTPTGLGIRPAQLCAWLQAEGAALRTALVQDGAWWLRGFGIAGASTFAQVVQAFDPRPAPYLFGQSSRRSLGGGVYTSTAYPATERIPLHGELSYLKQPPATLLLHCETPADRGGETALACAAELVEALPADTVARYDARGIRYLKNMHGGGVLGKSWQAHFEGADRAAVEAWLHAEGAEWAWDPAGGLRVLLQRPALRPHPVTGTPLWASQADLWHPSALGARGERLAARWASADRPTDATHGDGEPLDTDELARIRDLAWARAHRQPWEAGDLVILDNLRVMHGRAPFSGPRRIHVAMVQD